MGRILSTAQAVALLVPACMLFAAGCAGTSGVVRNEPGTTFGEIYVGYPRIAGRERLVNDRLEQERWLTEQLNKVSEQDLGFDGVVDIRNLLYSRAQLQAQFDPAYKLYAQQQAQALQGARTNAAIEDAVQQSRLVAVQQITAKLNKGEMTVDQANAEFEKLGVKRADISVGSAASAPTFPTLGSATPSLDKEMPGKVLLDAGNTASPYVPLSGASATSTPLQGSPIDRFRDLVAIREEIRTARIENGLDDAHDIKGNTLYRMTFDVTMRPRPDTSALAIVEMTATSILDSDEDLVQKIRRAFELESRGRVESQWKEIRQRLETECSSETLFSDAIECGMVDLSTRDQNYIWKALNQSPSWSSERTRILRREKSSLLTATSSQLVRQLLVDSEAVRLDDSPASCYLEIRRSAPASIVDPSLKNQSTRPSFDFGEVQTDVDVRLVSTVPPANQAEKQLRERRLGRYGCPDFNGAGELNKVIAGWLLPKSAMKSYAVTPKETVQRLSELGGNRTARELLLGLSAVMPAGGISAAYQQLRANDALYQAIRRQPIVVGVSDLHGRDNGQTAIGWMIGPQFQLSDNGASVRFRHTPKQQAVSATLSIPAWMGQIGLCVRAYWLTEDGRKVTADGTDADYKAAVAPAPACSGGTPIVVTLPQRPSTFVAQSFEHVLQREPSTSVRQRLDLTEGEPAKVLITGTNLWRSTEVYIGGQKADKISLTPDMEGVQATFNRIESPSGSRLKDGRVELLVFTSEGRAVAGTVSIARAKEAPAVTAGGFSRRLVADQPATFDLSARLGAYSAAEVRIQDPLNASLDVKAPELRIAQDDRRIAFSVPASALPGVKSGQLLNVVFRLKRSPDGAPIDLPVARNVVYFADVKDSKVSASLVGTPKALPITLNLTFPPAVLEGYGALAGKRPRLRALATLDGDEKPLYDTVCDIAKTTCRLRLTGAPAIVKEIADGKSPWKLSLAFVDDDAPQLDKADFDISR